MTSRLNAPAAPRRRALRRAVGPTMPWCPSCVVRVVSSCSSSSWCVTIWPMNSVVRNVNRYACSRATNSSRHMIATAADDRQGCRSTSPPAAPSAAVAIAAKLMMTASRMWPAVMFAARRTASENGLTSMPRNSTGIMTGARYAGAPPRKCLRPAADAVGLDAAVLDDHERDQRQRRRDPEVARGGAEDAVAVVAEVPSTLAGDEVDREQAEQVAEQDEEEQRPEVRDEAVGLVAEDRLDDVVAEEDEDRFEEVARAGRHVLAVAVAAGDRREDQQHQAGRDEHHDHVVGEEPPRRCRSDQIGQSTTWSSGLAAARSVGSIIISIRLYDASDLQPAGQHERFDREQCEVVGDRPQTSAAKDNAPRRPPGHKSQS